MRNYTRVVPRDLFNEASLLKCYGQIYLNLERGRYEAELTEPLIGEPFRVVQNDATGGITLANVHLIVRGERCALERPLNSRDPFPMYLTTSDDGEISVFNDDGTFTEDMVAFLAI